jgi:ring-1,2-phenylacetyl-CoA epoxidase subunit PaaD
VVSAAPEERGARLKPRPRARLEVDSVWRALAEIPDPEIPVISIVDLGVVADVRVAGNRVEVDFTPTFMGCPALDTMRHQMEDAVRGLDAQPSEEHKINYTI